MFNYQTKVITICFKAIPGSLVSLARLDPEPPRALWPLGDFRSPLGFLLNLSIIFGTPGVSFRGTSVSTWVSSSALGSNNGTTLPDSSSRILCTGWTCMNCIVLSLHSYHGYGILAIMAVTHKITNNVMTRLLMMKIVENITYTCTHSYTWSKVDWHLHAWTKQRACKKKYYKSPLTHNIFPPNCMSMIVSHKIYW